MHENAEHHKTATLGGTIDFYIQQCKRYHTNDVLKINVKTAGIAIKSVYGWLLALESF